MEVTRGRLQVKEVKTGEAAKKSRFEEVTSQEQEGSETKKIW